MKNCKFCGKELKKSQKKYCSNKCCLAELNKKDDEGELDFGTYCLLGLVNDLNDYFKQYETLPKKQYEKLAYQNNLGEKE